MIIYYSISLYRSLLLNSNTATPFYSGHKIALTHRPNPCWPVTTATVLGPYLSVQSAGVSKCWLKACGVSSLVNWCCAIWFEWLSTMLSHFPCYGALGLHACHLLQYYGWAKQFETNSFFLKTHSSISVFCKDALYTV